MSYKQKFEDLARTYIKRDGIEQLLECLAKSDFYTAPASTKYHDSEPNGLVKHSLNVFLEMTREYKIESDLNDNHELDKESIAIVSLFHDLCKIGFYKEDTKNVKENGVWKQVPYYTVDDKLPLGHGEKSVIMLLQHMKLTDDEIMAIRWHMGGFVSKDEYMTLGQAMEQSKLTVLLHVADLKATYIKR